MKLYDTFIEQFAQSRVGGWMFVNVFNRVDRVLIKVSRGKLSSGAGSRFHHWGVLLKCTGARSGEPREIPLLATPYGDDFILVASKAGAPKNPAWYYNLKAHPECTLIYRGEDVPCIAREAGDDERDAVWQTVVDHYSGYAPIAERTDRTIPLMILEHR